MRLGTGFTLRAAWAQSVEPGLPAFIATWLARAPRLPVRREHPDQWRQDASSRRKLSRWIRDPGVDLEVRHLAQPIRQQSRPIDSESSG